MSTNIVVPELGESVVEARVAKWLKKEGDAVSAGDALVELETEKIDLEVSADRAGVLSSIKHAEGSDVKVGEILAVLDASASAQGVRVDKPVAAAIAAPNPKAPAKATADAPAEVKASPTARNVAREEGVKLESIAPSAGSRVMKDDVLRAKPAAPSASSAPAPGARSEQRMRMSKRRATIARRLVEAQHNAAMLTTFNEVDMTAVMSLRARRKEAFQKQHGVGLGIASFFVKAAVAALKAFPPINAEIQGDEIVLKQVLRHWHGRRRRRRSGGPGHS